MTQKERSKFVRSCFTQDDVGRYCVLIFNVGQPGVSKELTDDFDKAVSVASGMSNSETSTEIYHLGENKVLWLLV